MSLHYSRRSGLIIQSDIRSMTLECTRLGGINLAQGVCDTEVPEPVRRGARAAIEEGLNSYTRFDGIPALRMAIADKLRRENGIEVDPEGGVVVSGGATGAFYCTCMALLDPGDEVILFEPYYGYHRNTLLAVEAVPRCVRLEEPGWQLDPGRLEAAVTPRTRALVINTPANPSGKVFTREELALIAAVAERRDLFVITDEIYEYFVYDDERHISIASLPGMAGRTITLSGHSKTFATTGWRLGFAAGDPRWLRMIGMMNDLVYVCGPSPLQAGVAAGMSALDATYYRDLAADYCVKRDRICSALEAAGLPPRVPSGAYYVLADASRLPGSTGRERAMRLLCETGVAGVPGEAFYDDGGAHLIRFCFAKQEEVLEEACRRLQRLA